MTPPEDARARSTKGSRLKFFDVMKHCRKQNVPLLQGTATWISPVNRLVFAAE
jgi:hypothetical protein